MNMAAPTINALSHIASNNRLGFAACIALVLHATIILGISFSAKDRSNATTNMEITLAQHLSQTAPQEADFLAQHNQEGSGTLEQKAMLTTRERTDFKDNIIREVSPRQFTSTNTPMTTSIERILSSSQSPLKQYHPPPKEQQENHDRGDHSQILTPKHNQEIASLEAKLDIQHQAYAKRPRIRRLTSVATKQSDDALYLHRWREKIEAVGNQNYPDIAKQQQIFGELRLVVSIYSDGSVHQVQILKSSGKKILDQAAIRIVHLAAPYAPFTQSMKRETDILEIIRTWRFHQNHLSSSS